MKQTIIAVLFAVAIAHGAHAASSYAIIAASSVNESGKQTFWIDGVVKSAAVSSRVVNDTCDAGDNARICEGQIRIGQAQALVQVGYRDDTGAAQQISLSLPLSSFSALERQQIAEGLVGAPASSIVRLKASLSTRKVQFHDQSDCISNDTENTIYNCSGG